MLGRDLFLAVYGKGRGSLGGMFNLRYPLSSKRTDCMEESLFLSEILESVKEELRIWLTYF